MPKVFFIGGPATNQAERTLHKRANPVFAGTAIGYPGNADKMSARAVVSSMTIQALAPWWGPRRALEYGALETSSIRVWASKDYGSYKGGEKSM